MVRDGAQTAEKILATAHGLFMERGYVGVSVNDVVSAVGITKPTLYYHFSDKEALYAAVADRALRIMGDELTAATANQNQPFVDQLTAVIRTIQSHADEDFRMMRHEIRMHLVSERQQHLARHFYDNMMAPIVALMQHGLDIGEVRQRSADDLAMLFFCLIEAYTGPEAKALQLQLDAGQISRLFLHGVAHN
ncbi:MAG: TetR/AcrR family transcriptional regulator [Roseiflexaceae bacterium]